MTEKIDFRLGGSSDKGEVCKSFDELEKGDKVYTYTVTNRGVMHVTEKKDYELEEVKRIVKGNAIAITLVTNTYIHLTFNIQPENSESQIACMSKFYDVSTKDYVWWIISTMPNADSEAKVVAEEAMKNEMIERKKLEKRKKMTTDESVNFRLGGSADKEYIPSKTFGELEEGDKFYRYIVDTDNKVVKNDYETNISVNDYDYRLMKLNKCWESIISKSSLFVDNGTSATYSMVYSTRQLRHAEAISIAVDAMKSGKPHEIIKIEESVDFRLGGSQNKDGRAEIKPFDKLEKDDDLYIYNVRSGNSVERTKDTIVSYEIYNGDSSKYKEVVVSLTNLDHPIFIYMTDEDLNKPCYVADSKTKVFSTYEMTDGEVIDALKNHFNY